MCKHDFKVYVSDLTVVTFCEKCGEIADVANKPSEYPVYPVYPQPTWPVYPYYDYQWQFADDTTTTEVGDLSTSVTDETQWSWTTGDTSIGLSGLASTLTGTLQVEEDKKEEETMDDKINRIALEMAMGETNIEEMLELFFGPTTKK